MILLGAGSNLPGPGLASSLATLEAALARLEARGIGVRARSPWYRSAPVPPSGQPPFVNGVLVVETILTPAELLARLHEVEREFGRVRKERNAARTLDLDLLAYDDRVEGKVPPELPHPRLHERMFVLVPLLDVAPAFRHPVDGRGIEAMIAAIPEAERHRQGVELIDASHASP